MANITKRKNKDGSTAYRVRVSAGMSAEGKQVFRSSTFTPPPGMTEKQAEKAAQEFAAAFERRVHDGIFTKENLTIDGLYEKWLHEYCERQLKPHTIHDYEQLYVRVSAAIGHIKLDNIKPGHIQEFYNQLTKPGIRADGKYKARPAFLAAYPKGKRQDLRQLAGISERTMTEAMRGRNVSAQTAEKLASAAGWAFSKAFVCTTSDTLSANSQRHYHAMLSSMFSCAVKWGLMESNPCERVMPAKLEENDVQFLDETEIALLLEALPDAPPQLSVIVQIALFTGARRGEICGLRWSDIDLDVGVMSINRTLSYIPGRGGIVFGTPKTKKSRRCIRLSGDCVELLKEYKQWQAKERFKVGTYWKHTVNIMGKDVKNDLLFTRPDGTPMDPNRIGHWFPEFLRKHNLPPCRFHSLRHSNAALLIAAHVPVTTVSGRLGHAQTSTTTNIYAGFIRSSDAAAADALEGIFSRIHDLKNYG